MSNIINSIIKAFGNDSDGNEINQTNFDPSSSTLISNQSNVDYETIQQADNLIAQCESFLNTANSTMLTLPFAALSRIRSWRVKRRDNKLASAYEIIIPKIKDTDKKLRKILNSSLEKRNSLKYQAKYLVVRLEACIKYCNEQLDGTDLPVEEIRSIVNSISSELFSVKSMVAFNSEIVRCKSMETISQSGARFLSVGFRRSMPLNDLDNDEDNKILTQRLASLRVIRNELVSMLSSILVQREMNTTNLENSQASLRQLLSIVPRDNEFETSKDNHEQEDSNAKIHYDHSKCTDCSIGYGISVECIGNLLSLQQQALQANSRLQTLVELRERMNEVASSFEQAISIPSSSSSFINNPTASLSSEMSDMHSDDDSVNESISPMTIPSTEPLLTPSSSNFNDTIDSANSSSHEMDGQNDQAGSSFVTANMSPRSLVDGLDELSTGDTFNSPMITPTVSPR